MQPSEKPFENGLVNTFFMRLYPRSPGPFRHRANKECLLAKSIFLIVMKNWNVQFLLEIIFHPQIMIPHEEINRNTTITKFC
jgi:hypothetical protein